MKKELLERGYHEYEPTRFDSDLVIKRYQKRFDNAIGKKYYIDVEEHRELNLFDGTVIPTSYEFTTQFTKDDSPINIRWFSGDWTIDSVEAFAEEMWNTMELDYYAVWGE